MSTDIKIVELVVFFVHYHLQSPSSFGYHLCSQTTTWHFCGLPCSLIAQNWADLKHLQTSRRESKHGAHEIVRNILPMYSLVFFFFFFLTESSINNLRRSLSWQIYYTWISHRLTACSSCGHSKNESSYTKYLFYLYKLCHI